MTSTAASATETFPREPVSARHARRFLRAFLAENRREELVEAAELALSEVVTNALLHAHTAFDVALSLHTDGGVLVEVNDGNPQIPVQRDYADQATTGRGMELVEALSADCGVHAHGDGKTVWFVIRGTGADDAQTLVTAWQIDVDDVLPADDTTKVVLLGLPPTLWLAAREHHDSVLRELALYAFEHPESAPPQDRLALADQARAWISEEVVTELGRLAAAAATAHRMLPEGHPSPLPDTPPELDVEMSVPADAPVAFGALQDVLDSAERLAVAGLLLARPGLPEIVAVRDWACEQAIAQQQGVVPTAWPGTQDERFTAAVHDRAQPSVPEWDASSVTHASRGVVAADDANRIVAISRLLAAALGWEVSDLVGRRVVALIPPELREAHVAGFTRHLTTGESHAIGVPLRLPVLRRDGTRIQCDFLIDQTKVKSGRTVYVAWIEPCQ